MEETKKDHNPLEDEVLENSDEKETGAQEEAAPEDREEHHKRSKKHECREEEYLFGWKRCLADFENYKKRQQESQKYIGEYVKKDLLLQILPVIDNFRSATEHIPAEQKDDAWVTGIMYIQKQLEDVLKENGVTEIAVQVGDGFNPAIHEAIANASDKEQGARGDEDERENKITKVVLKGYELGNKVIRPARVVVE